MRDLMPEPGAGEARETPAPGERGRTRCAGARGPGTGQGITRVRGTGPGATVEA
jgi:hypothetical protein